MSYVMCCFEIEAVMGSALWGGSSAGTPGGVRVGMGVARTAMRAWGGGIGEEVISPPPTTSFHRSSTNATVCWYA